MPSERFLRITRLLGDEVVNDLHDKFVVIVGMGAVGGYALEALVRSGVGKLRLVDFDVVSITNLNRQLLALESTIGRSKVEVAKERALDINPDLEVEILNIFAHEQTLDQILLGNPDLVIDAIDSLNPKCALLQGTYERGIPIISSMGAALRRDPSLIRTGDLMDTWGCPLAKQVRTNLRKRGVGRGIEVVFSPELVRYTYKDPLSEEHADFNEQIIDRGRRRNVLGSLPSITGIFGLTLAHLALDKLVGGDALHGQAAWNPQDKH